MGGFGMGEAILLILVLAVSITSLLGFDALKKGLGKKRDPEVDRRVLDELDVLRLRLDVMSERLDEKGIQKLGDAPHPPGDLTEDSTSPPHEEKG